MELVCVLRCGWCSFINWHLVHKAFEIIVFYHSFSIVKLLNKLHLNIYLFICIIYLCILQEFAKRIEV